MRQYVVHGEGRGLTAVWAALLLVAAGTGARTVAQVRGMPLSAGTMGESLLDFLASWTIIWD